MGSDTSPLSGRTVAILGCGALGSALAHALGRRGASLRLWSRHPERSHALAERLRAERPEQEIVSLDTAPATFVGADVALLALSDGALSSFARDLAPALPAGTTVPVLHASGPLGVEVLEPLARVGLPTGKLHPLAALARARDPAAPLAGAWYALSGAPRATERAAELVAAVGGHVLVLADEPGAAARYHGAATLLAGGTVALFELAQRLLADLAPEEDARRALHTLLATAVRNLSELTPATALTGPVARGERDVVQGHLAALGSLEPGARAAYRALGPVMVDLALAAGVSEPRALEEVRRLFD